MTEPRDWRTRDVTSRRAGLWILGSLLIAAAMIAAPAQAQQAEQPPRRLPIAYVELEDDARYEPIRATERIVLRAPHRPWHGAALAVDDAAALARVTRTTLTLERMTAQPSKVGEAIAAARAKGIALFLLDLPASELRTAASALKGGAALAFNVAAPEDALRRELCEPSVVHVLPSNAMRADALLQHLVSRKWREILLLEGPEPDDATFSAAVQRSAKKLGVRIAAHTKFKLGNDPRERDLNNPALLTAINRDYDVVVVADRGLEMARQLPFRTVRPRPVAGALGLEPVAWHWTWDRHGGPQLNGRFQSKSGGLRMDTADWAAWISIKMISEAVLRTSSTQIEQLRKHILLQADGFDGAKGLAVSVRPWDQQLRQPMMLATDMAVAATAPIEGFLHQTNRLDSLGDDAPETPCRLDRGGR